VILSFSLRLIEGCVHDFAVLLRLCKDHDRVWVVVARLVICVGVYADGVVVVKLGVRGLESYFDLLCCAIAFFAAIRRNAPCSPSWQSVRHGKC